ncbi:HDOD domain-containing protein [Candidatus Vondammii sp. HM_W22]|uniref:HDOD domain-containing protein n=1 Tax=Candidatus Vondammii sp. HM_W22 TaxID=2687299 RepID=UPI001F12E06B|nr:HDOD domain-containing protein [Candidatus Vondammii sp. HM_W22]
MRVKDAVEQKSSSAHEIADMVDTDAALSTRLLQVANSPLYRGRMPIKSIQMAVPTGAQPDCQPSDKTDLSGHLMFWIHACVLSGRRASRPPPSAGTVPEHAMITGLITV